MKYQDRVLCYNTKLELVITKSGRLFLVLKFSLQRTAVNLGTKLHTHACMHVWYCIVTNA